MSVGYYESLLGVYAKQLHIPLSDLKEIALALYAHLLSETADNKHRIGFVLKDQLVTKYTFAIPTNADNEVVLALYEIFLRKVHYSGMRIGILDIDNHVEKTYEVFPLPQAA